MRDVRFDYDMELYRDDLRCDRCRLMEAEGDISMNKEKQLSIPWNFLMFSFRTLTVIVDNKRAIHLV